jgi:hypothetical protein
MTRNRASAVPKTKSGRNETQTPFDENFDSLVKSLLQEWHVAGLSVAVVDGDQTFAKVRRCVVSKAIFTNRLRDMVLQVFRTNQLRQKHFSSQLAPQSPLLQRLYHYSLTTMHKHVPRQVSLVPRLRMNCLPGKVEFPHYFQKTSFSRMRM